MSAATKAPTVAEQIAAAVAERDKGMALAELSDLTGWNRSLIDQGIDYFAATRRPFSANDLRELLPSDVPPALIGNRFQYASRYRKVIRFAGSVTSTKKNTHAKPVARWVGVHQGGAQ